MDEVLAKKIFAQFLVSLEKAYKDLDIAPVAGAEELFKALKKRNILVVLNTGYNEETARSLTKKLGWREGVEIDGLITATDVKHNRPKPDMILLAMKRFNVPDAGDVVKVGDSIIDIEEGENAGCGLSIGITTGAHTKAQLQSAHPDHILNNLLELLPILDHQH
jgi:phosphonatase-like hydrolase